MNSNWFKLIIKLNSPCQWLISAWTGTRSWSLASQGKSDWRFLVKVFLTDKKRHTGWSAPIFTNAIISACGVWNCCSHCVTLRGNTTDTVRRVERKTTWPLWGSCATYLTNKEPPKYKLLPWELIIPLFLKPLLLVSFLSCSWNILFDTIEEIHVQPPKKWRFEYIMIYQLNSSVKSELKEATAETQIGRNI